MKNVLIPIYYVVRAQSLYVDIFEIEDSDFPDNRALAVLTRTYNQYLEKMFLDDTKTAELLTRKFNSLIYAHGDFVEICDLLRSQGYIVMSRDNCTKSLYEQIKRDCFNTWKEWKKTCANI